MYVPPRALLFVPAHRERFREKARTVGADAIILDLEDAVPPAEKDQARTSVEGFLRDDPGLAFVRINPIHSVTGFSVPCGDEDLAAVVRPGLKGVLLPKIESHDDIVEIDAIIRTLERVNRMDINSVILLGLVETAAGIHNLADIVTVKLERPLCLSFGAGDFTGDLGVEWTGEENECRHARGSMVIACRAGGLPAPIDSVYADIRDTAKLKANTVAAKAMGFQSKLVIHPDQVAIVQDIFTPQPAERDWADRVLQGLRDAEAQGHGAYTIDNKLVDYPILERARAIQRRYEQYGLR